LEWNELMAVHNRTGNIASFRQNGAQRVSIPAITYLVVFSLNWILGQAFDWTDDSSEPHLFYDEKLEEKNERTTLDFNKLKAEHYSLMSDN